MDRMPIALAMGLAVDLAAALGLAMPAITSAMGVAVAGIVSSLLVAMPSLNYPAQ